MVCWGRSGEGGTTANSESEFDALRMKEDETLDSYTGQLTVMSVKFSNLGGTLDDAAMVKKLFNTMPDCFINIVARIKQFFDLQKLAFEEAVRRLKAFEERTRWGAGSMKSDSGQLLLTQAEWEARQKRSGGGDSSKRGRS